MNIISTAVECDAEKHRARHIVNECEIVADGHRLMTLGAHTGHVWRVIAMCENAEIAAAIAGALTNSLAKQST